MENEELLNVFENSNSISEVLKKLHICDNSSNWKKIKLLAIEVEFSIDTYKNRRKKFCLNCGKELKHGQKKFCSNSCSATFNNKGRVVSIETKEKIRKTLSITRPGQICIIKEKEFKKEKINTKKNCENCGIEINKDTKCCSVKCASELRHKQKYNYFLNNPDKFNYGGYVPKQYKDFFMKEQNNKCAICGCDPIWNGWEIQFVIDHIDGDASNNSRENLRMICPNCDSQTDTFKFRNKHSTRRNYWKDKIIRNIKDNGRCGVLSTEIGETTITA